MATLIIFLDKHLAKDDLTDSLEKFDSFDDFERKGDQSMTEFIAIFDAKYRKIEKKKMTLPPEILAFKLLKKANITKEEKLLVLTGMDFAKKDTLYEEAKKSLRKFKGGPCDTTGATGGPVTSSIKLEPAFLADHEEALLAAGYTKTRPSSYSWKRGWRGGRGGQARAQSWNGSQKNADLMSVVLIHHFWLAAIVRNILIIFQHLASPLGMNPDVRCHGMKANPTLYL